MVTRPLAAPFPAQTPLFVIGVPPVLSAVLLVLLLLAVLILAPLAAWYAEQPPCDGQEEDRDKEDQDDVRLLAA